MSYRYRLLSTLGCLIISWAAGRAGQAQVVPEMMSCKYYLIDACEKLDCYFTIEKRVFQKDSPSTLWLSQVVSEEVNTVEELVEKLRRELKGVKVERVKREGKPPVIHLIEESLAESKGYPLDRRVSLKFRGTLRELLAQLEEEPGGVVEERVGVFPFPLPSDSRTKTDFDAVAATVRDVLTQAVLLKGYARFLWEAEIVERDGKPLARIRFTGPKDIDNWQKENDGEGV